MALRSAPSISSLPRNALVYVTVGALLVVWTGVWYAVYHDGPISQSGRFWLLGLFFTGLALIVIGVVMGPLARYERDSELPPIETTGWTRENLNERIAEVERMYQEALEG